MKNSRTKNIAATLALLTTSVLLTGCYVVPLYQAPGTVNNPQAAVASAPVVRPIYTARLYPTNDTAATVGRLMGTISNPERGHGEFAFTVASENFSGEATRQPGSAKGTANASGNRGGYVKCDYTMTNAQLGSGKCVFANGATYDMHISQ